jgi:C-terminal processing protease CtpA/Prc/predicted small lipoprotein YifL
MMSHRSWLAVVGLALLAGTLAACGKAAPTKFPTEEAVETPVQEEAAPTEEEAVEPEPVSNGKQPVQITGTIEVSNESIIQIYFSEYFAYLEDLTGFVQRDYLYTQPLEGQILGPVAVGQDGSYGYTLNLPARPVSPFNDVDNDGEEDAGVQVWQIVMGANLVKEPFLDDYEMEGWSTAYTSARIDSENKDEINGGKILVWAPDNEQAFPTGFGDDGLLFTEDDPVAHIPAGYTLVDLDREPFELSRSPNAKATLYEGEIVVNDLSELGWAEAFDALFEKASREYPFTEMKGIDWDALYDKFSKRVAEAEAGGDIEAYYLAMRDFSWSIPDGHVGLVGNDFGLYATDIAGSYGFAVTELDDGSAIANIVSEDGPAAEAGMEWGATILEWNGEPVAEAAAAVVPWSSPFSSEHLLRMQQYRYLVVDPLGTEVEVTFQNPGAASPTTASLTAVNDGGAIFGRTSVYYGFDRNAPPVEYEILPSGYGYVAINSLSDDINLTIRLWQKAIGVFVEEEVPGVIVDLRQNMGGAPIGDFFGKVFVSERMDLYVNYYYSDETGQLETFRPPKFVKPDPDLHYDGSLAVLVSPACASACEQVAYVLGQLEQTRVVGYYPTNGIFGEVARGQYLLPGGYQFQIPTGLSRDLAGNTIIEGTGVVPDVVVPRTVETMQAEYVEGKDVALEYAVNTLDEPIGTGITPASSPRLEADFDLIEALLGGASTVAQRAREAYMDSELSQPGRTYVYTVPLGRSTELIWTYAWCTASDEQLKDNMAKTGLVFTLDGEPVEVSDLGVYEGRDFGSPCRIYYAKLSDWAVGEHILTTKVTFSAPFSDGTYDYPAGTHTIEYHVIVAREG